MSLEKMQLQYEDLNATVRDLRSWIDQLMIAKGLKDGLPSHRRAETLAITAADVEQLKEDIGTLIRIESRRSFWSGLAVNAVFFVLGLVGGVVVDVVKSGVARPF